MLRPWNAFGALVWKRSLAGLGLGLMALALAACSRAPAPHRLSAAEREALATELRTHPSADVRRRIQALPPEEARQVMDRALTQGTNDAVRRMNLADFAKADPNGNASQEPEALSPSKKKGADAPEK